jgi:hypothetical protein
MKAKVTFVLVPVASFLAIVSANLIRAQQAKISAEANAALRYFLQVDCEIDTPGQALTGLLKFPELIPALVQVLQQGPDAETIRENDRLLEEQWNSREQFLGTQRDLGLTEQQLQTARQTTKEAYVKTAREQFIRKYRQKAAVGLAAFNTAEAQKALRIAANDPDESLRTVVKAAQVKYQKKK